MAYVPVIEQACLECARYCTSSFEMCLLLHKVDQDVFIIAQCAAEAFDVHYPGIPDVCHIAVTWTKKEGLPPQGWQRISLFSYVDAIIMIGENSRNFRAQLRAMHHSIRGESLHRMIRKCVQLHEASTHVHTNLVETHTHVLFDHTHTHKSCHPHIHTRAYSPTQHK